MSQAEQLHTLAWAAHLSRAVQAAMDMEATMARVEAVLAEVSTERHTSEDHRRCGLCGELTQAAVCCGQEV